jgi:hypothetical protein
VSKIEPEKKIKVKKSVVLELKIKFFLCAGCSFLRAGGFSCSLDGLHGGLRI